MRRDNFTKSFRPRLIAGWLAALAGTASAQSITGTLLHPDNTPASGVIIVATRGRPGAGDSVLARTISGGGGRYVLDLSPGTVHLRALRIGQRPFVIGTFELAAREARSVRTVLPNDPIVLQPIVTTGSSSCRKTGAEGVAVAEVFEEARKALLSTQLTSRERKPVARISEFTQERSLGDRETSPKQISFFEGESLRPFVSLSPDSLAKVGYAQTDRTGTLYWAPDADVLLSEIFAATHCLDLVAGKGDRAGWIGLSFRPAKYSRGYVDISGTLWLDRESSELRRMEFGYDGLPQAAQQVKPGGSLVFTRLPEGLWFVSKWEIRMPHMSVLEPGAHAIGLKVKGGDVWRMTRGDELIFTNGEVEPAVSSAAPVEVPPAVAAVMADTTMTLNRCEAAPKGEPTGMVQGVVYNERGAPLSDAVVTAEWQEKHSVVGGALAWQTAQFTTLSARDGYFALCGVPRGRLMTLGAQYGTRTTAKVTVQLAEQETKARVDLRVPVGREAAAAKGVVVRVREASGRAVPYALVEVEGGRGRVTDDSGRVVLSAAPDTVRLAVRRIGFTPYLARTGRDARSGEFTVALAPIAQALGAVTVTASVNAALDRTGFYDRVLRAQRGAFNADFITPEELEARAPMRVTDLFSGRRFIATDRTKDAGNKTYLRGRGGCKMSIFLDGRMLTPDYPPNVRMTDPKAIVPIDEIVDPNSVAAIEIYASAANAPAELIPLVGAAQEGACGIVAIWTGGRR